MCSPLGQVDGVGRDVRERYCESRQHQCTKRNEDENESGHCERVWSLDWVAQVLEERKAIEREDGGWACRRGVKVRLLRYQGSQKFI